MNTLEKLRGASNSDVKQVAFHGVDLRIRRMSAMDGIALNKITPQAPFEAESLAQFHAFAVSKCLIGDDGELDTDTDEGRAALIKLPLSHLVELSEECLSFSGLTGSKKNESGTNSTSSHSDSALPSESNTLSD